jgi:hypothetical protein
MVFSFSVQQTTILNDYWENKEMVGVGTESQKALIKEVETLTGLTFNQIKVS